MKLATCPYCEARFLYPDVRKSISWRTGRCPHCGKEFRVSKRGFAVYLPCAAAVLVALDDALLAIADMNLIFLCAASVFGVVAAWLLLPFAVRYRKQPEAEDAPPPRKSVHTAHCDAREKQQR
jgi:hypothetical protein